MIIYKITNNINGKVYIGQTVRTLKERIAEHVRKKKPLISKALKKYDIENFTIETIDKAKTVEELNIKENEWVKFYNCISPLGYNLCDGGGNTVGYHYTNETKLKMSISKKEYI